MYITFSDSQNRDSELRKTAKTSTQKKKNTKNPKMHRKVTQKSNLGTFCINNSIQITAL